MFKFLIGIIIGALALLAFTYFYNPVDKTPCKVTVYLEEKAQTLDATGCFCFRGTCEFDRNGTHYEKLKGFEHAYK